MDQFVGIKYKLKSSENFEEYLKFIEVGYLSRKTATAISPSVELVKNDDGSYTMVFSSTFRTIRTTFRLGEEFVDERADGVKVKSLVVWEGGDLVQTQTEENGRKSTHTRHFTPETLTVTVTAVGWDGKCVRIYEAVKKRDDS